MAAYSDIPPQPMLDLTNFNDDLEEPGVPYTGSLLDAVKMVLDEDNTPQWMTDMLTLQEYYRVKFKKRQTVQKFIWHCSFLADNKENQAYSEQELTNLSKVVHDLAKWIDKRKCEALDESHWPVDQKYLEELKSIYDAFPTWKNTTSDRVMEWYERMVSIKQDLETETTQKTGLSARDIFNAHVRVLQEQNPGLIVHPHVPQSVTDVEMYVDRNLNPPAALQSDIDIQYTVV